MKIVQKGILNRHEAKVLLKADHVFGNFTQELNAHDKIWFKGVLKTSLNSKPEDLIAQKSVDRDDDNNRKFTKVELSAIGCLHCSNKNLKPFSIKSKLKMESRMKDLRRALKYLLNTLFNPLFTFK